MKREYYSNSIALFIKSNVDEILGKLTRNSDFDLGQNQRDAWIEEINVLQKVLASYSGSIYFEYSIPRMGKRIDVVLIIGSAIFILEFKIGDKELCFQCKQKLGHGLFFIGANINFCEYTG